MCVCALRSKFLHTCHVHARASTCTCVYMYMYVHMCVCMCVSVCGILILSRRKDLEYILFFTSRSLQGLKLIGLKDSVYWFAWSALPVHVCCM